MTEVTSLDASLSKPHDADLLAAASSGDRDAFAALYDRHVRAVFRFAVSQSLTVGEAEDVTQDTFVIAFRKARTIRLVADSALPWLLVTCRNLASATRRRAAREQAGAVPEQSCSTSSPATQLARKEASEAIFNAVAELSPQDQQIFALCIEQGHTYTEAAAVIGVSHGTIRNRLSRLRTHLRSRLQPIREENL